MSDAVKLGCSPQEVKDMEMGKTPIKPEHAGHAGMMRRLFQ